MWVDASAKAIERMPCQELPRTAKKKPSNSKPCQTMARNGTVNGKEAITGKYMIMYKS